MADAPEPRLMQAFLEFGEVDNLDKPSKTALRLCNKQIKAAIDATVIACTLKDSDALIECYSLGIRGLAPLKHLKQLKNVEILSGPTGDPSFPVEILKILTTSLKRLTLGTLTAFPPAMGLFQNLEYLLLHFKTAIDVPESIGNMSSLEDLRLFSSEFVCLPDSFSKLTTLEDVALSTNMIGITPLQHLTGLTRLKFLSPVEEDPEDDFNEYQDFIWKFTLLKSLCLEGSRVDTLPDGLGNLKNLETLRLCKLEYLEELPESIGNLKALNFIEIDTCPSLLDLPESIGKLTSLENLFIKDCGIVDLPESIGNLHALQRLVFNTCEDLTDIPDSFVNRILARPHEKWPSVCLGIGGCSDMIFSDRALLALEILRGHKLLVTDFQ